ncbi:hypothetical protein RYH80_18650 [Halobaculum sp. MBLA0147]|uniref:hypothetical protein n=1 Tax=Halobaculum sp. MBLA0147 TaxID=3079934 RepID=UPI003526367A
MDKLAAVVAALTDSEYPLGESVQAALTYSTPTDQAEALGINVWSCPACGETASSVDDILGHFAANDDDHPHESEAMFNAPLRGLKDDVVVAVLVPPDRLPTPVLLPAVNHKDRDDPVVLYGEFLHRTLSPFPPTETNPFSAAVPAQADYIETHVAAKLDDALEGMSALLTATQLSPSTDTARTLADLLDAGRNRLENDQPLREYADIDKDAIPAIESEKGTETEATAGTLTDTTDTGPGPDTSADNTDAAPEAGAGDAAASQHMATESTSSSQEAEDPDMSDSSTDNTTGETPADETNTSADTDELNHWGYECETLLCPFCEQSVTADPVSLGRHLKKALRRDHTDVTATSGELEFSEEVFGGVHRVTLPNTPEAAFTGYDADGSLQVLVTLANPLQEPADMADLGRGDFNWEAHPPEAHPEGSALTAPPQYKAYENGEFTTTQDSEQTFECPTCGDRREYHPLITHIMRSGDHDVNPHVRTLQGYSDEDGLGGAALPNPFRAEAGARPVLRWDADTITAEINTDAEIAPSATPYPGRDTVDRHPRTEFITLSRRDDTTPDPDSEETTPDEDPTDEGGQETLDDVAESTDGTEGAHATDAPGSTTGEPDRTDEHVAANALLARDSLMVHDGFTGPNAPTLATAAEAADLPEVFVETKHQELTGDALDDHFDPELVADLREEIADVTANSSPIESTAPPMESLPDGIDSFDSLKHKLGEIRDVNRKESETTEAAGGAAAQTVVDTDSDTQPTATAAGHAQSTESTTNTETSATGQQDSAAQTKEDPVRSGDDRLQDAIETAERLLTMAEDKQGMSDERLQDVGKAEASVLNAVLDQLKEEP